MFTRGANPIWYMPDLSGFPLDDTYYALFLTNTLPYLPQNVYRDPVGATVWTGDVVQFMPNGTLPNNLYGDPNAVYRIEIRQGMSQSDPLIYEIENYIFNGESISPEDSTELFGNDNMITNPQFSQVNFNGSVTYSLAGTYSIAPGWDLVLTGAGTTTVTQIISSGDQFTVNPPPPYNYAIQINNNGWTTAVLRQRFNNNGSIFQLGAVSGSLEGFASSANQRITMSYVPSNTATTPGAPTVIISNQLLATVSPSVIANAVDISFTGNANLSSSAYVDINLTLPTASTVTLSNIQLVGQSDPLPVGVDPATLIPSYKQQTEERIIDHLFHYYKSQLVTKPKASLLTGWNFPQNPYQFITTTVTTVSAQCSYIADQTILFQNAASQVQTGQNVAAQRYNFVVKAVTASTDNRFALIQYIDPATAKPYWSYILSAFARSRIFTDAGSSVRLKCRLIYRSTLPSTIGNSEPIASWTAGQDPTFSAGWTALAPLNDPAYVLPNSYSTDESLGANSYPGFSFDKFQLPNDAASAMTLGIVIYTMDQMNSVSGHEDSIAFDRVSLIPSYFGADALPETFDESLRKCQYYYEKSYQPGDLPGTANYIGARFAPAIVIAGSGTTDLYEWGFDLEFKTPKRSNNGVIKFYSPTGTADKIQMAVWNGSSNPAPVSGTNPLNVNSSDFSFLNPTNPGTNGVITQPTGGLIFSISGTDLGNNRGQMFFHFTSDARLGT